jgi:hypothetical protein
MSLFAKLGDFMAQAAGRQRQALEREAPKSESRATRLADLQKALGAANRRGDAAEAEKLSRELEASL